MITLTQSMMESRLFVLLQNNYFDPEHDADYCQPATVLHLNIIVII
jgi:hypothetical protein